MSYLKWVVEYVFWKIVQLVHINIISFHVNIYVCISINHWFAYPLLLVCLPQWICVWLRVLGYYIGCRYCRSTCKTTQIKAKTWPSTHQITDFIYGYHIILHYEKVCKSKISRQLTKTYFIIRWEGWHRKAQYSHSRLDSEASECVCSKQCRLYYHILEIDFGTSFGRCSTNSVSSM